uniref:Cyclin-dependent kinase 2-interacting protein n=1 Tax=Ciona savignyi TaxID=51511 RepID=H2ZNQ2_CIOSA
KKKKVRDTIVNSPRIQGQLTGIPRQIKDTVTDIHNFALKWQKLNTRGCDELSRLADVKLNLLSDDSKGAKSEFYSDELLECCDKLNCTYKALEVVSKKLDSFTEKLRKLDELSDFSRSNSMSSLTENNSPFVTWSVNKFYKRAFEISKMHAKELLLKKSVVENAAHLVADCRNILMTFSSSWLHEPFINEAVRKLNIETMLLECGHE